MLGKQKSSTSGKWEIDKPLTVGRSKGAKVHTDENNLFIYRWDDILPFTFDHGEKSISFQMPLNIEWFSCLVVIIERSTKAFIVHGGGILTEVDLESNTTNSSEEFDPSVYVTSDYHYHHHPQVSIDGRYVGFFYSTREKSDPHDGEAIVQINHLTRSESSPKYIRLIDPKPQPDKPWTFSADLSMLYTLQGIYDLSSATADMTSTPLSCPTWDFPEIENAGVNAIFSSCNRFVCLIYNWEVEFRVFEICHLKKCMTELHLSGPTFTSSRYLRGFFHPCLPVLLLDVLSFSEIHRVVEIDLSNLEITELCSGTQLRG